MSHTPQQSTIKRLIDASLSSCSLRDPVRRSQALRYPQVNSPKLRSTRPLPRRIHDSIVGRGPLDRKKRQDTSRMTVNTRVMFRITLYYVPCQAISLPRSMALLHPLGAGERQSPRTSHSQLQTSAEGNGLQRKGTPTLDYAAS